MKRSSKLPRGVRPALSVAIGMPFTVAMLLVGKTGFTVAGIPHDFFAGMLGGIGIGVMIVGIAGARFCAPFLRRPPA